MKDEVLDGLDGLERNDLLWCLLAEKRMQEIRDGLVDTIPGDVFFRELREEYEY